MASLLRLTSHVTELWVAPSQSLVTAQLLPFITVLQTPLSLLVTHIVFTWLDITTIIHFQWARAPRHYRGFSTCPTHLEWSWPLIGPEWSHDLDTGLWLADTPCHEWSWSVRDGVTQVSICWWKGGPREWSAGGDGGMLDDRLTPTRNTIHCATLPVSVTVT